MTQSWEENKRTSVVVDSNNHINNATQNSNKTAATPIQASFIVQPCLSL